MSVTEPLFQQDAYLRSCTATVIEAGEGGVVLDRSVFYPLGGGQPGDTGTLRAADGREWRITDARKGEDGRILHVLEAAWCRPRWAARSKRPSTGSAATPTCACTPACTCSARCCATA